MEKYLFIYLLSRIGFQISFNVKQSCEIDRFFRFLSMGFWKSMRIIIVVRFIDCYRGGFKSKVWTFEKHLIIQILSHWILILFLYSVIKNYCFIIPSLKAYIAILISPFFMFIYHNICEILLFINRANRVLSSLLYQFIFIIMYCRAKPPSFGYRIS